MFDCVYDDVALYLRPLAKFQRTNGSIAFDREDNVNHVVTCKKYRPDK